LHVSTFLLIYLFKLQLNNINNRSIKQKNRAYHVQTYRLTTTSGTLRRHLYSFHEKEWVAECKQHNITIKLPRGLSLTEETSQEHPSRPLYSKERFMDALVNFIVVTDQVFYFILFYFISYY
jgi:hypothetical protein